MPRTDFLLVAFGRVVTALISVAGLRIMTTLLAPSEYGEWALLVAFQTFCALFLINPVDQHLFRHAHAWWDEGVLVGHLRQFNRYIRAASMLIAVVVALWGGYGEDASWASGLMKGGAVGLIVYFATWNLIAVTLLNVLDFRVQSVVWTIIAASSGLMLAAFFGMQKHSAVAWLLGQATGMAVGTLGAWRSLRHHAARAGATTGRTIHFPDFLGRSTIIAFCFPLAAATGFMWLQNTGYRFLVNSSWGTEELAILVVGLGVSAQLAAIVESLAMQFLYPYFARRVSDANSDEQTGLALSDVLNVLAPVYAIWAGFNAVCAATLLEILTDARYHVAVPFVIFGAVIEFARCLTNLWSNTARAVRETWGLILPYGLGAAIVWSGGIGVAHFGAGLTGMASVLVAGGLVTCAAMVVAMQRLLHVSVDVPRLTFGAGVMSICVVIAIMAPPGTGALGRDLVFLFAGAAAAGLLILGVLWRNPALTRLLSTTLRKD